MSQLASLSKYVNKAKNTRCPRQQHCIVAQSMISLTIVTWSNKSGVSHFSDLISMIWLFNETNLFTYFTRWLLLVKTASRSLNRADAL